MNSDAEIVALVAKAPDNTNPIVNTIFLCFLLENTKYPALVNTSTPKVIKMTLEFVPVFGNVAGN